MSAVGKEPHLFSFSFSSSRGTLLDWFGQIMLYSHWSTQTWRSTNAWAPATDEAVVCTLIEPSNAMQGLLSDAALRLLSLAEQCNTQKFYLRCFKSDIDAVKSKYDLHID